MTWCENRPSFSFTRRMASPAWLGGDNLISPLVIRSQPPLAEEPEKSTWVSNCTKAGLDTSVPLYLPSLGTRSERGEFTPQMELLWWPGSWQLSTDSCDALFTISFVPLDVVKCTFIVGNRGISLCNFRPSFLHPCILIWICLMYRRAHNVVFRLNHKSRLHFVWATMLACLLLVTIVSREIIWALSPAWFKKSYLRRRISVSPSSFNLIHSWFGWPQIWISKL